MAEVRPPLLSEDIRYLQSVEGRLRLVVPASLSHMDAASLNGEVLASAADTVLVPVGVRGLSFGRELLAQLGAARSVHLGPSVNADALRCLAHFGALVELSFQGPDLTDLEVLASVSSTLKSLRIAGPHDGVISLEGIEALVSLERLYVSRPCKDISSLEALRALNRPDFWTTTSNKQLNFVQHIKSLLAIHGRAAVVVPDNVLFEGGAGETVRRGLLQECDVHTILRLPTGLFYAQGVKANVVFFDRKPGAKDPWTREVWFYDLRTNKHFTLKTKRMTRADLDEFVACYRPGDRHKRKATWSEDTPHGRSGPALSTTLALSIEVKTSRSSPWVLEQRRGGSNRAATRLFVVRPVVVFDGQLLGMWVRNDDSVDWSVLDAGTCEVELVQPRASPQRYAVDIVTLSALERYASWSANCQRGCHNWFYRKLEKVLADRAERDRSM